MRHNWPNFVRTFGVAACGFVFLAASCEQKKKDPAPTATTGQSNAATNGAEQDGPPAEKPVEKKSARSVGPEAPAIFAIGGLKGYTEPCGCTMDVMLGGIDRIAGYTEEARKLYPAVDFVDAGDLLFETPTLEEHELAQERAKVDLVVQGLAAMKVQATVPGERDFAMGTAYYLEQIGKANIQPIAANLSIEGTELAATRTTKLGETDVLYIGVVDPELYEDIKGVQTTEPKAALKEHAGEVSKADVTVLLVHGEVPFAKSMLKALPGVDFAVVGHDPRETDQVDEVAGGFTLEPYDQGRYFGVLKLFNTDDAAGKDILNAGTGSKAELEKIDRQIEHVNESINKIPPPKPGEEAPAILVTLRERLETLQQRKTEIKTASVEVPADKPAFLWRSVPMEPGFTPDPELFEAKEAYNAKLRELNDVDRDPIPPEEGKAEFIGTNNCATCHAPAHEFWTGTKHSKAIKTLEDRNKVFDQKCIGCHVVGYEQPGGSVIGALEYDAKVKVGDQTFDLHKDLQNVGCESCHGPGSMHRAAPVGPDGKAQHIIADPTAEQCGQCHVPEHSPRFRFDTYVKRITGEGHAMGE